MAQFEETNTGIAVALARLGDEEMRHFSSQKSVKIKRIEYKLEIMKFNRRK